MTPEQTAALLALCERFRVPFHPDNFGPTFDLPEGWVAGWIGDPGRSLYVGVNPAGEISS